MSFQNKFLFLSCRQRHCAEFSALTHDEDPNEKQGNTKPMTVLHNCRHSPLFLSTVLGRPVIESTYSRADNRYSGQELSTASFQWCDSVKGYDVSIRETNHLLELALSEANHSKLLHNAFECVFALLGYASGLLGLILVVHSVFWLSFISVFLIIYVLTYIEMGQNIK